MAETLSTLDEFQTKLNQIPVRVASLQSNYEVIMADWIELTIQNINLELGMQVEEAIESLEKPVLFIGPTGLSDISSLKSGKFDLYLRSLFSDLDRFMDFEAHFKEYLPIMDYCLTIWRDEAYQITDIGLLEELIFMLQSERIKGIFEQRIKELTPNSDEHQDSLDDFF